jgi:hypothetical protein
MESAVIALLERREVGAFGCLLMRPLRGFSAINLWPLARTFSYYLNAPYEDMPIQLPVVRR